MAKANLSTTREFNADDWTGDVIAVDYDADLREFEMYGYTFTVTHFTEVHKGDGFVQLLGDDWAEPLATLYCHESNTLEDLIIRAARFVRNRV